jgi:hypothetical protein
VSPPVGGRRLDERVWTVATQSTVVVFHVVLVVAVIIGWLSRQVIGPADTTREVPVMLLVASGITAALSLVVGGVLVSRKSATARGIGLSVAASGIILLIIGVCNELWIY